MGAAATFAANASSAQPSNNITQQPVSNKSSTNIDLFGTDDDVIGGGNNTANVSNQYQQPSSLVITGDDDDDFDPRSFGR